VAFRLFESEVAGAKPEQPKGSSIVTGTVVNNCDLIVQGKVLVRIPSLDVEVWARLTAIGAGSGAGFLYVPRPDDEVVVALNNGDPDDAFVLGGLWSSSDSPPADSPLDAQNKRVIKTGLKGGVGHEVEFDDALQSIKIESSTKQKLTIEPTKIEIANTAGTLVITLDDKSQTVTVKGVNITLEAAAQLTLKGRAVEVKAEPGPMTISSTSDCSIKGAFVRLN
jgi:uncharacterized protein involved in type VI secretion and phage assembly